MRKNKHVECARCGEIPTCCCMSMKERLICFTLLVFVVIGVVSMVTWGLGWYSGCRCVDFFKGQDETAPDLWSEPETSEPKGTGL